MRILVLGGGVFLGPAVVGAALERGHAVGVFNRGRARRSWPTAVEVAVGDRNDRRDLGTIAGRHWDAVVDTCGYVPADLAASTAALAGCGRYLFVSSVSAYASFRDAPVREGDALADFRALRPDDRDPVHYGAQKAACEAVVERAFGARALIVRPGLIVGPGDPTGRFDHWPWRFAGGGEVLMPAAPVVAPLQFIDVRDLAGWMLSAIEDAADGAFNATGPAGAGRCGWSDLVGACRTAAVARAFAPADAVAVDEAFLQAQGVAPWTDLPLWLPSTDADHAAFMHVDVSRAVAAGLVTRPLVETVGAVLDAGLPPTDDPRRARALAPAREAELLARWRRR